MAADESNYPNKPLKMLVGFAPGAATDIIARILAQKLNEQMKVPVIVENRAGSGGDIVFSSGARAAPDGYTVIFNTGSLVQNYAQIANRPYHPVRDFAPVTHVSDSPLLLVVSASLPVRNMAEFMAYAKANPGKLSYGTAGIGNITHLGSLLMMQETGLDAVHIPYRGSNPAMVDLIAGRVHFSTPTVASAMSFLVDKTARPLMVMSRTRSPALPDVPTGRESIGRDLEVSSWLGVLVPAQTPAAIIDRLNKEIGIALNEPQMKARLSQMGAEVRTTTPEQYGNQIKTELDRWTKIIESKGLKRD